MSAEKRAAPAPGAPDGQGTGASVTRRQALLARYLDDPAVEAEVRADPAGVAARLSVDEAFVAWLAALEPRRVLAFRKSRAHKDQVRGGKRPTMLG